MVAASVVLIACGQIVSSAAPNDNQPLTIQLGYFPNLTHAPALVGIKKGFFVTALGSSVTIETHTFNAGGDAVTAILSNHDCVDTIVFFIARRHSSLLLPNMPPTE